MYSNLSWFFTHRSRVDQIIEYFTEAGVNLALLYFHEPDSAGHTYGPDDPRVLDMVVQLDGVLGYLINKLQEHGLFEVRWESGYLAGLGTLMHTTSVYNDNLSTII